MLGKASFHPYLPSCFILYDLLYLPPRTSSRFSSILHACVDRHSIVSSVQAMVATRYSITSKRPCATSTRVLPVLSYLTSTRDGREYVAFLIWTKKRLCCGLQTRMAGDRFQEFCNRASLEIDPVLLACRAELAGSTFHLRLRVHPDEPTSMLSTAHVARFIRSQVQTRTQDG